MRTLVNYNYERIKLARKYMDEHYHHNLDLEAVSGYAGFSRFHFIRLFRATYGKTPHQYLTRKRIERAKDLLAHGNLPVTEVCFAVGFQSLGSFCSLFYRVTGCSPSAYRARYVARRLQPLKYLPACYYFPQK